VALPRHLQLVRPLGLRQLVAVLATDSVLPGRVRGSSSIAAVRFVVMREVSVLLRARMRKSIVRGLRDDRGWLCVVEAAFSMLLCFALMCRAYLRSFYDRLGIHPFAKRQTKFLVLLSCLLFFEGDAQARPAKGCVTSGWPFCNTYSLLLLLMLTSPLWCRPVFGCDI
jgi:hypothetical protein